MAIRIALIHATPVSIQPIEEAFKKLWPEVVRYNLLDDSLSPDLVAAGRITEEMDDRFLRLAGYCVDCGADAILFSCSAFGTSIDKVKKRFALPVQKPNEAMIEQALDVGTRIGLLATAEISIRSMRPEFEEVATARGKKIELLTESVPEAMKARLSGDAATHDELIVEKAGQMKDCDVLVLTQFSMSSALPKIEDMPERPVLTTPDSAVARLKEMLLPRPKH
jgi:Asp/Glu/hydantoin racemase